VSPPKVWNMGGGKINNKKVIEPFFGDSQNLTSSGKPCVRPLKKLPYKVYIFLRGPCFLEKCDILINKGSRLVRKIGSTLTKL
jgi:hypothetical protein